MSMLTARKWRRLRNRAGRLLYMVAEVQEKNPSKTRQAEEIYRQWQQGKITYRETEKRIQDLAKK